MVSNKKILTINFDINKTSLKNEDKKLLLPFLEMGKEVLENLGPGFFHQVYRRAFWDELRAGDIDFVLIKNLELNYNGKLYGSKDIRLFKINDLLISINAIKSIENETISVFSNLIKHYQCKKGLLFNFNSTKMDYRFIG